jgi:hypothetical protein
MTISEEETSIPRITFSRVFGLLINVFIWYYIISATIDSMLSIAGAKETQILTTWVVHYIAVLGFGIAGAILSERIAKEKLLQVWIITGAVVSCLPIFVSASSIEFTALVAFLLGGSFGFGMPSCLAYFADNVVMKKRGSKAGLVFLATNLVAASFVIFLQMVNFGLATTVLIAAVWRGLGLTTFLGVKHDEKKAKLAQKPTASLLSIFRNRSFMLYFAAWLFFCLIDRSAKPILSAFFSADIYNSQFPIEPIIGSVSALVGGTLADSIGRKHLTMFGFVILGLAYAVIGIAPPSLYSWYVYMIMDAIGAGILWVNFILVLWGDLALHDAKEKYYLVGSMPFFITDIVRFLMPVVLTIEERTRLAYAMLSIASFFLFLAVIPLFYAPETLPEKEIKERELKGYIEKAKKIKEKHG